MKEYVFYLPSLDRLFCINMIASRDSKIQKESIEKWAAFGLVYIGEL